MAFFGLFSAVFGTIVPKVQANRRYTKQVFPMRAVFFMAIQLSKDGKCACNKACTTPWCHGVVHFEVKMSCFPAVFRDNRRKHGGTSIKQAVFVQR